MPRIRTIKPEFFSHEELAEKSAHARLLAIGLLTLADCKGRLRWVPMLVHAQVFPWEASVDIETLLGELISASYLLHYEVDGKRYVQITNFLKHQRISGKEASYESLIPPPPENPIKTNAKQGKHPDASQGSTQVPLGTEEQRNRGTGEEGTGEEGTGEQGKESLSASSGRCEYSGEFERFWNVFPRQRRSKKQEAYRKWKQALKRVDAQTLISRAADYAESELGRSEYAVMPGVWLNAGMWEDEPEAWKRRGSKGTTQKTFDQQKLDNTRDAVAEWVPPEMRANAR